MNIIITISFLFLQIALSGSVPTSKETEPEYVDLCQQPVYSPYQPPYADGFRQIVIKQCETWLRPIVAFVYYDFGALNNSGLAIFDGTFTGTQLPITMVQPMRASGPLMSIRGHFSSSLQVVVSDRFTTKDGHDCGGLIVDDSKVMPGAMFLVEPECAYVFAGNGVQLGLSPGVAIYKEYDLLNHGSLLESQPVANMLNIFTAYPTTNTAVTLYVSDPSDTTETLSFCHKSACTQMELSLSKRVQPFYIPPLGGSIYINEIRVNSSELVILELVQPTGNNGGFTLFKNSSTYVSPGVNDSTCAYVGEFSLRFYGYLDDVGMYARFSIAPPFTQECKMVPWVMPTTSEPPPYTRAASSATFSVSSASGSTAKQDQTRTTPDDSSSNYLNLVMSLLITLSFSWFIVTA